MGKITIKDTEITVIQYNNDDYICLTDMIKVKDGDFFCYRLVKKQKYVGISWYLGTSKQFSF
jgi:hypothetical protein